MNLKKLLIACVAGMTIIGTSIIPSVEVKAATSSPIYEETVSAYREDDEVNARICLVCGQTVGPSGKHKCSPIYY